MTSAPKLYTAPKYSPPLYYRLALKIAKPLYRLKVWQRSRRNQTYKQEVDHRFAFNYPARPHSSALIWCHAVSLGETNTAAPLLNALMAQGYSIWLTNTTHTGFNRADELFADAINTGQLVHTFVPVDTPKVVKRFLDKVAPVAALFVETELWPVMLSELNARSIPSILVNGRLSEKSFENYQRFASVSHNMMKNISLVIAQNAESAKRFRRLHLDRQKMRIAESLKWSSGSPSTPLATRPLALQDNEFNSDDKENLAIIDNAKGFSDTAKGFSDVAKDFSDVANSLAKRPVWVAASTHDGEERIVIEAHKQLIAQANLSNAVLILVPRHPERFDTVAKLLTDSNMAVARRSTDDLITATTQVYLADTMGELMHWYQLAHVALVGGSLVDIGGHNPIEAAKLATPIIMGPYTQTCQLLVDKLTGVGAMIQLLPAVGQGSNHNANVEASKQDNKQQTHLNDGKLNQKLSESLFRTLQSWLTTPILATKAGERGQALVIQKQGAVSQQLEMILPFLPPAPLSAHTGLDNDAQPSIDDAL